MRMQLPQTAAPAKGGNYVATAKLQCVAPATQCHAIVAGESDSFLRRSSGKSGGALGIGKSGKLFTRQTYAV